MKKITVHDAAQKLNVSTDTIRRWEKKGLIKASRSDNNYRVFNLDEIDRLIKKLDGDDSNNRYKIHKADNSSGYTVIDLFSGAGGTALGLENAGLEHKLLVEIDKNAAATLRTNRPNWNVIEDDIANVDFTEMSADIVEGGFPCQSFSYAGKKGGFEDTRGTLFFEFARCVKEVKPKIAIGENVRGLHKHDNGRTLSTMINTLEELGYKVAYKILRSQYLDVPQKRERLIIIGVRNDLDTPILFPKEKNYFVSLREALENVPQSSGQSYPEKKYEIMKQIPPGGYWRDLPEEVQKEYMGKSYYHSGGKTGMARRLSWDEPSLTLTTSPAQKQTERCHPEETRPLTVREYARIQTFPDEWVFEGSTTSQYKQIGNAVPVNLGYHIGQAAVSMLNKTYDKDKYVSMPIEFVEEQMAIL
ncbi:DNA (cytosine-5-)-methyltransferase [Candidatus Dojkabacteria bacterium]|nr:DNA (cytosine-5-)-methyltransferase [Candidatus Dojkabacteria bacterium]